MDEVEKQLFFPQYKEAEEARQSILLTIRRAPEQFGYNCSRWKLEMIAKSCPWLKISNIASLCQLLKRLKISYKRGRDYVHSPDLDYDAKLDLIESMYLRTINEPEDYAFLYLDELSYYRQPTLARAYESTGKPQPLAKRSHSSERCFRVLAAVNALTGQLSYRQRKQTNISCMTGFWYEVWKDYSEVERIYIVVDNWPVHLHPDVLAPLQEQNFPFPPKLPSNWPIEPSVKAKRDNLPIQLLLLPTYASWLNPIEKLWRWLKQDILHLHRLSDDWPELRQRVEQFLAAFSNDSPELLRYIGLLPI